MTRNRAIAEDITTFRQVQEKLGLTLTEVIPLDNTEIDLIFTRIW